MTLVGPDICDTIRKWFMGKDIPQDLGQALTYVIPKQPNPESVKHLCQ